MSEEIVFRLEATLDDIQGKREGGIIVDLQGEPVEIMQIIFSAMHGYDQIAGIVVGAAKLYTLRVTGGDKSKEVNTCPAFLAVMRKDQKYAAEITAAVVTFWEAAGVNTGQLPQLIHNT